MAATKQSSACNLARSSKSKQTSILDFDMPKKERRVRGTTTTSTQPSHPPGFDNDDNNGSSSKLNSNPMSHKRKRVCNTTVGAAADSSPPLALQYNTHDNDNAYDDDDDVSTSGGTFPAVEKEKKMIRKTVCYDITVINKQPRGPLAKKKGGGSEEKQIHLSSVTPSPKLKHQQQPALLPVFREPWLEPYKPALSNSNGSHHLPSGVIDIDSIPHTCCLNSQQSHAGISWITSKRRCGCVIDTNHNTAESMTESYLGSYGVERYSRVGLAGKKRRGGIGMMNNTTIVNSDDWKIEQWWLDETRKDLMLQASSIEKHLDFMPRQPSMTIKFRKDLMDWLFVLTDSYSSETFWLCAKLIDRSLASSYPSGDNGASANKASKKKKRKIKNWLVGGEMAAKSKDFNLLGIACMCIAAKIVETAPLLIDEYVRYLESDYTAEEIVQMEAAVCKCLKYSLNFVTPANFVHRFLRASCVSSDRSTSPNHSNRSANETSATVTVASSNIVQNLYLEKLVFYLLDLAVLEYKLVVLKKPSLVAAAALYLARATLGIREHVVSHSPLFELSSADASSSNTNRSTSPTLQRALKCYWSKTLEYYTGYDKVSRIEVYLRVVL